MNRLPSPSTRYAPSPRSASETSGCCSMLAPRPRYSAVGWNWTNSMSVTTAPARSASATPSPVDTTGLVVAANTWPMPPVARTTARARIAPTPSSVPSPSTCNVTPQARPVGSRSRSSTRACSTSRIHGSRRTEACRARCTSAPVASPPACTIRLAWCPPSRVSIRVPSAYRSNWAPQRISSRTRAGPSVTSTSTAAGSPSPTPATRVSSACAPGLSNGSSTAAIPPCAHRVEPASILTLVTTVTCSPASRRCSAAVSPATPDPTTTTSVVSSQPGAGARSRRGTVRSIPPVLATGSPGQRAGTQTANCATDRGVGAGVAGEGLVAAQPGRGGGRADVADVQVRTAGVGGKSQVGQGDLATAPGHRRGDGAGVEGGAVGGDDVRADELAGMRIRAGREAYGVRLPGDAADRELSGPAAQAAGPGDETLPTRVARLRHGTAEEPVRTGLDPTRDQCHPGRVPVPAQVPAAERATGPARLGVHEVDRDGTVVPAGRPGPLDEVPVDLPDVVHLGGVRAGAVHRPARPGQPPPGGLRAHRPAATHLRGARRRVVRDRVTLVDPPDPGGHGRGHQGNEHQPVPP